MTRPVRIAPDNDAAHPAASRGGGGRVKAGEITALSRVSPECTVTGGAPRFAAAQVGDDEIAPAP
jgi:hypothetical protein